MTKNERKNKIVHLIQSKRISNQHQLLSEITALGIPTNQASISRDLNELGVVKLNGIYHLPNMSLGDSHGVDILEAMPVGSNLIVLKLMPALANSAAARIDQLKSPDVAGTIAGDDTVFVAVFDQQGQKRAMKLIFEHFRRARI